MKKSTLRLIGKITGNHYHRIKAIAAMVFAIFLCGMSSGAFAQTTITITTPNTIAASNVCPGATNVNIYAFTLTGSGASGFNNLTAVSFTQSGTAGVPADVVRYRLWKNAGGGSGTLVATSTTTTFTGISGETFSPGTIINYWITADIATGATATRTITVSTMSNADITTSGANAGTGTVAGGTQTIVALPTVASLGASPASLCGGGTLTLTAGPATGTGIIVSYNWSGPGSSTVSNSTNPYGYTTPFTGGSGAYSVTVTYPGAGCTSAPAVSSNVTVNDQPNLPATMYICITGGGSPTQPAVGTVINSGVSGGNWTSSNTAVMTVEPTTGRVWPAGFAAGGTSTITQTVGGCSASTVATRATRPAKIRGTGNVYGLQHLCSTSSMVLSSATNGGVWSSAFPGIAVVTNPGGNNNTTTVTAVNNDPSAGLTTIIYTDPATGCDTVTDLSVHPRPFDITKTSPGTHPNEVCVNATIQLNEFGNTGSWTGVWSSSVPAFATVAPTTGGSTIVTGVSSGLTYISYTVTSTGCFKTYSVNVNPIPQPITGYSIVCTGSTTTLSDVSPGGAWQINPQPSVATISGGAPGTQLVVHGGTTSGIALISYSYPTDCRVIQPVRVNLQPGPIGGPDHVCAGNTITLVDSFGGTWTSSSQAIATVDSVSGVVYGQYAGPSPNTATIFYNVTACTAVPYGVTVNPAPGPITGVKNVCVGYTTALSDTTAGGVWSSSGPSSVATISGRFVTGVSVGYIVDTYTLPNKCFDTVVILVNSNPDPITGADTVCQGATTTLSNASVGGTWSSTDLGIAQVVDSSGVVTGVNAGFATISYTLASGCYAVMTPFRVKPPVVATVDISRDPGGITCAGMIDTFIANQTNGGIPEYQWYKFVTPVGTDTNKYWADTLNNGDLIVVRMITHFSCAVQDTIYDSVVAVVYPIAATTVSITSSPSNTTADYLGQVFTFFANVTWGGGSNMYQWFKNGVAIPGANLSSYSTPVYQNDTFFCQVTGVAPCDEFPTTGTSNAIVIYAGYLGTAPSPLVKSDLVLFPNPSMGTLTLSGAINTVSDADLNIEVYDIVGHLVYTGKTKSQSGYVREQIDLGSNVAPGAYLLRVNSESVSQVFRFVISR